MDDFATFSAFLETEATLKDQPSVDGPPAIMPLADGVPVDMEYITGNSSSYSWCVVA